MTIRHTTLGMLVLSLSVLLLPLARAEAPEGWLTDLNKGKETAAKEKKPVLVMVSASWCGPCKMMKSKVFPEPAVKKELASWVKVYIDGDEQEKVRDQFDVEGYPTFVFLDAAGKESGRQVGGMGPAEFAGLLSANGEILVKGAELDQQIKTSPKDPALLQKKGTMLLKANRMNDAREVFEKARELDPTNKTGVAADLALLEAMKAAHNDQKKGEQLLVKLEKDYPTSPRVGDALFFRAIIAANDDKLDQAKKLMQEYVRRFPKGERIEKANHFLKMIGQMEAAKKPESK